MEENMLYKIREEARKSNNIVINLKMDIDENIMGVVVKGFASASSRISFEKHSGEITMDHLKINILDKRDKDNGKKFKPKAWYKASENMYHISKVFSTFFSSEEDEWFDLEIYERVQSTFKDVEEYTLNKKAASVIDGYKNAFMKVEAIGSKYYRFNLSVETYGDKKKGDNYVYINRFQWTLNIL